ncbi:dynein light chain Tctex-type 5-like isoform X1 [Mytilus galloprovincialis]|uniref:dynein light chain Tctex-type 5-like isoform X1 n=1 Tax=Mytilus galloprovincialis TaxID=29158 RepID=UPI003F7CB56F
MLCKFNLINWINLKTADRIEMASLTVEALKQHQNDDIPKSRKLSTAHRDGSDGIGPSISGPSLRRYSRLEPRPSVQYGASGRRMSQVSRTSISGTSLGAKLVIPVKIQNTYRLEPQQTEKFNAESVQKMMTGVLSSYLDGEVYDQKLCAKHSQELSDVIKKRVKELGFPRYKLVCNVMIGQNSNQGLHYSSRCLWNKETDNYAEATYSKGSLFAVATMFATYFE